MNLDSLPELAKFSQQLLNFEARSHMRADSVIDDEFSVEVIEAAIHKVKLGKAGGPEGVTAVNTTRKSVIYKGKGKDPLQTISYHV